jgi:patatin-like phospholipase/acyl hydrolase
MDNGSKIVRLLSIDGGGIRGIIVTRILAELENILRDKLGKSDAYLMDYIDLIVGTSTGAILGGILSCPGRNSITERYKYDATAALKFYKACGPQIFSTSYRSWISSTAGWTGPKYSPDPLESVLSEHAGELRLSQLRKKCIFTAWDLPTGIPLIMTNLDEIKRDTLPTDNTHDFYLKHALRASSAAPTYFPPVSLSYGTRRYELIDGGVYANTPTQIGLMELRARGYNVDNVKILSMGCGDRVLAYKDATSWGKLQWSGPIIDILVQGNQEIVHHELLHQYAASKDPKNYMRINPPIISGSNELDDITPKNMEALIEDAETYININRQELIDIVNRLVSY